MKFAIVVFPGSNCDHDAYHAVKHVLRRVVCVVIAVRTWEDDNGEFHLSTSMR